MFYGNAFTPFCDQDTVTSVVVFRYLSDGSTSIRKGIRDNAFVVDKALTSTGFDGTEEVDWTNLVTY